MRYSTLDPKQEIPAPLWETPFEPGTWSASAGTYDADDFTYSAQQEATAGTDVPELRIVAPNITAAASKLIDEVRTCAADGDYTRIMTKEKHILM